MWVFRNKVFLFFLSLQLGLCYKVLHLFGKSWTRCLVPPPPHPKKVLKQCEQSEPTCFINILSSAVFRYVQIQIFFCLTLFYCLKCTNALAVRCIWKRWIRLSPAVVVSSSCSECRRSLLAHPETSGTKPKWQCKCCISEINQVSAECNKVFLSLLPWFPCQAVTELDQLWDGEAGMTKGMWRRAFLCRGGRRAGEVPLSKVSNLWWSELLPWSLFFFFFKATNPCDFFPR